MMLGDPGIVEAELIGAQDLLRNPMVNVAVGIRARLRCSDAT